MKTLLILVNLILIHIASASDVMRFDPRHFVSDSMKKRLPEYREAILSNPDFQADKNTLRVILLFDGRDGKPVQSFVLKKISLETLPCSVSEEITNEGDFIRINFKITEEKPGALAVRGEIYLEETVVLPDGRVMTDGVRSAPKALFYRNTMRLIGGGGGTTDGVDDGMKYFVLAWD